MLSRLLVPLSSAPVPSQAQEPVQSKVGRAPSPARDPQVALFGPSSVATRNITRAITNARVSAGNPGQPWAQAISATAETRTAAGTNQQITRQTGLQTRIVDAKGQMMVPDSIDTHVHQMVPGFSLAAVQLRNTRTNAEFIARIKAYAATIPKTTWIAAGNRDHQNWGGELPSRQWIDSVTRNNPVGINRLDGHMSLANTKALAAANVSTSTQAAAGEPAGVFKDNAIKLFDKVVPSPTPEQSVRAQEAAMNYVAERGVTPVDHMGALSDLEVLDRADKAGKLKSRLYAAVPRSTGQGNDYLAMGALQAFVDGSLGSPQRRSLNHSPAIPTIPA